MGAEHSSNTDGFQIDLITVDGSMAPQRRITVGAHVAGITRFVLSE